MATLNDLLRAEVSAVNQQFFHVLALRRLGDTRRADRIYEVDAVDFPLAMQIIDLLVARGESICLPPELPRLGRPTRGILEAELESENRLQAILASPRGQDEVANKLFEAAARPRAPYRAWLRNELQTAEDLPSRDAHPSIGSLLACLIAVIERRMVDAFVAWHRGEKLAADVAWASSGVAMLQLTELCNALTDSAMTPRFDLTLLPPALRTWSADDEALIACYVDLASNAATNEADAALQAICARIAAYARLLDDWKPDARHPALSACSPAFASFDATLRRFVWAAPK